MLLIISLLLHLLAFLPRDLDVVLEAMLLGHILTFLSRSPGALSVAGGDARGNQLLSLSILTHLPRHLSALLGVDVLLDLLGLLPVLQLANLLFFVMASLLGGHEWHGHLEVFALFDLATVAHLSRDGAGSVVALGFGHAFAIDLGLTVRSAG